MGKQKDDPIFAAIENCYRVFHSADDYTDDEWDYGGGHDKWSRADVRAFEKLVTITPTTPEGIRELARRVISDGPDHPGCVFYEERLRDVFRCLLHYGEAQSTSKAA